MFSFPFFVMSARTCEPTQFATCTTPVVSLGREMAGNIDQYQPNADATRFLLRRQRGNAGGVDVRVIVNWPTLLNQASGQ